VTMVTRIVRGQREKLSIVFGRKNDMEFLIILRAVLSLITCIGTCKRQGRNASIFFFISFHLSAEKKTRPSSIGSIFLRFGIIDIY